MSKQHEPWFGEECSELLNQRKEATVRCSQKLFQINGDDPKSIKFESIMVFKKNKGNI